MRNTDLDLLNKVDDNYLVIEFGYSNTYVLPYTDGIKLIEMFKNAEAFEGKYENSRVIPLTISNSLQSYVISNADYRAAKLSQLMDTTVLAASLDNLKVIEKVETSNDEPTDS